LLLWSGQAYLCLCFSQFSRRFNADVFIRFIGRLLKATDVRKIILVIDSHPAHNAERFTRWIEPSGNAGIAGTLLPTRTQPEFNPDEMLNQNITALIAAERDVRARPPGATSSVSEVDMRTPLTASLVGATRTRDPLDLRHNTFFGGA